MKKYSGEQMMSEPKAATTLGPKPLRGRGSKHTHRSNLQLALGTLSFAICFAAWGLISAFAPHFREVFHLTATQTAFLVAIPVLLGALLRVATGMLADRFGGRAVFALLMIVVAVPAYVVPMVPSYRMLLYVAFFLGMAGSSFAVGMGFVSRWFPRERQGGALGVYGLGNIGQSAAVFLGPVLAVAAGWQNIFRGMAALLVIWGVAFFLLARNASKTVPPSSLAAMLQLLSRERLSWVLSLFYFLTFGGFVAFSIYLPVLLKDQFGLKPADASYIGVGIGPSAVAAMKKGEIDAISNLDPVITRLERDGDIVAVADTRTAEGMKKYYGGDYAASCIYSTQAFVDKNPGTVQAVAKAIVRALQFARKSSVDEILAVVPAEYYAGDRDTYKAALAKSLEGYSPDGRFSLEGAQNVYKVLKLFEPSVMSASVDVSKTFDNRFADAAAKK